MKNKFILFVTLVLAATLAACTVDRAVTPTPHSDPVTPTTEPVSTIEPTATPRIDTPTPMPTVPSFVGTPVSFGSLSLTMPPGLASGASGSQLPCVEGQEAAWWQLTPGHIQLELDGYPLQDKLERAVIYVYPAQTFAELQSLAAENIQRLQAILDDPAAPIPAEQLPRAPFLNSMQMIASHIQVVDFQNGQGVRMLTQYAQDPGPINNRELIYHFEGLTNDGQYYVVAILPVIAPVLQENETPGSAVPEGGVPMPDLDSAVSDMQDYYAQVQQLLDGLQPGAFTPDLEQLDLMIQSMRVGP